jgi:tetratricopeptide (TPR) repeat protein
MPSFTGEAMTQQNERRPALELRYRWDAYQALACLSTLLLFFGLVAATSSRQAFGNSLGLFQQSAQQLGDKGTGSIDEKDVRAIEAGKPINRELAGGQQHVYRIGLGADRFLKVIVDQQGIDVIVQVSGPDGNQILEFDSESRSLGQEEVSLVAEATGAFLLIVRPKHNGILAGSYEIRIEESRVATDTDRDLHDARKQYEGFIKLRREGKYDEALPFANRALEIRERLLEPEHPDVAIAINSLADIYTDKGEYANADLLYRRSLASREKTLDKDHPDIGASLYSIAMLYHVQGKYVEAEPLYKRALDIREKSLGKDHSETAFILGSLGNLYKAQGKYVEAEPLLKRALEIYEKALGKDHPATAGGINNLAVLYEYQGKYEEAEPLYTLAIEIYEKALGKDHPKTSLSLHNLASIYYRQGNYEEAERLYNRVLKIREKSPGQDHPNTAACLNELAIVYRAQGKYGEAEPLQKRALDIWEKKLSRGHPNIASGFNNLAELYRRQGKYEEAEPLYKRALDTIDKIPGKGHPYTASILNNLALLYVSQGKYEEAEPIYRRALDIREKSLGQDHPGVAQSLDNLAVLYMGKDDLVQAVKFQSRANTCSERDLARKIVLGSERQKLAYLATISKQTDRTISLHLLSAPDDPAPRNMAATLILQRKGRTLDATSANLNALRSRLDREDQALLDRLTETRSQIARLVLGGPQRITAEQYQARIKELEDQAEKYMADISRRSNEFRAQNLPVTLETVRTAIPPDSALIEFATYRPFNAKATKSDEAYGQPRYVAYVLRYEGEIAWRELGEAQAIDTAIAALRKALRDPKRNQSASSLET